MGCGSDQEHSPWDPGLELSNKGWMGPEQARRMPEKGISGRGEQNWIEWASEVRGVHMYSGDLARWHIGEQGAHWGRI